MRSLNPFSQPRPSSSVSSSSTPTIASRGSRGLRDSASTIDRNALGTVFSSTPSHNKNRVYGIDGNDDGGLDPETRALIAELLYKDLEELNTSHEGKVRSGVPLTDTEYAMQVQAEQLESMLREVNDGGVARGMQDALRVDQEVIGQILLSEKVAQQDRVFALALSRGEEVPRTTVEQRAMEGGMRRDDASLTGVWQTLSPGFKTTQNSSLDRGKERAFLPPAAPVPPPAYNLHPPTYRSSAPQPECISCGDKARLYLKAPCDHHYCPPCITKLVNAATTDESLFPVRCCRQNIPAESFARFLSQPLLVTFQIKSKEFGTPANMRVYCSVPTCSAFLGDAGEAKRQAALDDPWADPSVDLRCDKCYAWTCSRCQDPAHPEGQCKHNTAAQEVKDLARAQGWQTCPACERIIELSFGCNHMTCYCGYEFCYECAAEWKTCRCEQWEEERLYVTAQARLEREYGERARVERPVQWQRELQAFAQNLRVNHDCYPGHRFKDHSPGYCEECGYFMPVFTKMCRDCRLTVCKGCSLNRLR